MEERETFGISVRKVGETYDGEPVNPPMWEVFLPHQCDRWEVALVNGYKAPVPYDFAVEELERFVCEAQAALAALRNEAEFGPGGD